MQAAAGKMLHIMLKMLICIRQINIRMVCVTLAINQKPLLGFLFVLIMKHVLL